MGNLPIKGGFDLRNPSEVRTPWKPLGLVVGDAKKNAFLFSCCGWEGQRSLLRCRDEKEVNGLVEDVMSFYCINIMYLDRGNVGLDETNNL